tara:strand:+ start:14350 stop:14706 length:357 start_codon:yes stop_codon:yes gene_type:complete
MVTGCRSSGNLVAGTTVLAAHKCKLVSIHGCNFGGTGGGPGIGSITIQLFDHATAATGDIVAQMIVQDSAHPANTTGHSLEYDMHGVMCRRGLVALVTVDAAIAGAGTALSGFTVEFV